MEPGVAEAALSRLRQYPIDNSLRAAAPSAAQSRNFPAENVFPKMWLAGGRENRKGKLTAGLHTSQEDGLFVARGPGYERLEVFLDRFARD